MTRVGGVTSTPTALVEVDPEAWDALLEDLNGADAYLRRGYVESASVLDEGRAVFLHLAEGDGHVVFPGVVRDVPGGSGLVDVTTPYGYGGPVGLGVEPPARRFYELYDAWCRANGVVTTFLRFHPLFANWRHAPPGVRLDRLADTATWPLDAGEDLLAGMHQMHRRGVRKAARSGVEVTIDAAPEALDDFVALYEEGMRRRSAEAFYFFPAAYWPALREGLGEALVRLDARLDGELLASHLLLATPPWLHYHLGATSERGFALGASKLLFLESARFGRENGFAELHLGSGLGGREDSLWQFKQRLSPAPGRQFWIGKLVHDAEGYAALAGTSSLDGFFPAYRTPAP